MSSGYRPVSCIVALCCAAALSQRTSWGFPPNTLAEALQRSEDRAHRRIPLLAVAPERTSLAWSDRESRDVLSKMFEEYDAKPPLPDVLTAFKYRIVSCGSVQTVAPRSG